MRSEKKSPSSPEKHLDVQTPNQENFDSLLRENAELRREIEALQKEIWEKSREFYGLSWVDVPEAFEEESKNKIPVLEEVREKAVKNNDGKPTHILIEGDNFHALTCLNYTHRGKIDVIYIDPPYNTGNDGFNYKDARYLTEFPNGEKIDKNHPLRHSAWLSFMAKRLKLAKNLLSGKGVIFISIDDNEQANLKLLCDKIFGEGNFLAQLTWESTTQPTNAGSAKFQIQKKVEYILCYARNKSEKDSFLLNEIIKEGKYPHRGRFGACRFEIIEKSDAGTYKRETMKFDILGQKPRKGKRWQIGEITARDLERRGRLEIVDGIVKKAVYPEDELVGNSFAPFWSHFTSSEYGTALNAKDELNGIMGYAVGFDTVKPVSLLCEVITHFHPNSTILDFFAGSGTTMHAATKLNAEDGGKRQCILVTNNESQICEKVTYERNRRVMCGYEDTTGAEVAGLGSSMKYYRTAFVGGNDARNARDRDRRELSLKAGTLLSLAENTLEEADIPASEAAFFQIFSDGKYRFTAVYFSQDWTHLDVLAGRLKSLCEQTRGKACFAVYVYCDGTPDIFEDDLADVPGVVLKAIPRPILEIYKTISGGNKR